MGYLPGIMSLYAVSSILNQCFEIEEQNPTGMNNIWNNLNYCPEVIPNIDGRKKPKHTSIAIIPKKSSKNQLKFHYDATDYDEECAITYYSFDTDLKKHCSNLRIAVLMAIHVLKTIYL